MRIYEGKIAGDDHRIGIVVSRFNEFITGKLLNGAVDCLTRHEIDKQNIGVYWVPGAFEIAVIAKDVIEQGKYDAVICLGAIIRGETPHFDYIAAECSKAIAKIAMEATIPVIYGVLTTDTTDQAVERAGTKAGNRGFDAALASLEMISLRQQLKK